MTIIPVGRLAHPIKTMLSVKRKSKISDVITSLEKYKKEKRNGHDMKSGTFVVVQRTIRPGPANRDIGE